MKFLTKLAQVLMGVVQVMSGLPPVFHSPKADKVYADTVDSITKIAQILGAVQASGISAGLTNEQKLLAATPLVAGVIKQSEMFFGHSIPNDKIDEFNKQMTAITQAFVEAFNLLKTDNIKED